MKTDDEKILDIEEFNENLKAEKSGTKGVNKRKNIIFTFIIIALFIVTSFIGVRLQNERVKTQDNSRLNLETPQTTKENTKAVSEKYKITTLNSFDIESEYLRGEITISKEKLKALREGEIFELLSYISKSSEFTWVTLSFEDNTGLVCLPDNKSTLFYGALTNNGLIDKLYGVVLKEGEKSFVYIENDASFQSDEAALKNETSTYEDNNNVKKVYITSSGTKYHNESCAYLTKSKIEISLKEAKEKGYLPCSRCIK